VHCNDCTAKAALICGGDVTNPLTAGFVERRDRIPQAEAGKSDLTIDMPIAVVRTSRRFQTP
jgi:hypothetical protein